MARRLKSGKKTRVKKQFVTLFLASKNEEKNIERFFSAIEKQTRKPDEIILVDSSTDNTAKLAKKHVDKLIVIPPSKERQSAGFQRNIAVKESKGDVLLSIDLDAEAHSDWVESMLEMFENPEVQVVQGQVFSHSYNGEKDHWMFSDALPEKGEFLNNCNTAYRRQVLEEFPFDENNRWEDVDLAYRLRGKYTVYGCKKSKVFHFGIDSQKVRKLTFQDALNPVTGWVRLIKKYKNFYWIARVWYNILYPMLQLDFKKTLYFSVAFFYVSYLEFVKKPLSNFFRGKRNEGSSVTAKAH